MRNVIIPERLALYIRISLLYITLWLIGDAVANPGTFFKRVVNHCWLLAFIIALNYLLYEYTLPFLRAKWQRVFVAPFVIFGHLMLHSFGFYAWRYIGIQLHIYFELKVHPTILKGVEYHFPYSLMSVIFFGAVKHIYEYRRLKLTAQKLRIEKQEAELQYLKAQTNPHFLFNTLNNIYSLARDKSDAAPQAILQLSKILRFMLYEINSDSIPIEQELKIINDYIALERLRYDDTLRITTNYEIDDATQMIPPLLLIPLVENAFKHGVSETLEKPFIDIHLMVVQRHLTLAVRNSADSLQLEEQQSREKIGLSNLRRQLELLFSEYRLQISDEEKMFIVTLSINLASYVEYNVHYH